MTDTLPAPAPLVPAHVNLSTYEWMPFYGEKLQKSDHNAVGDQAYRASINIWWAAWRSIPAASLPNDDLSLQKAADLARDPKTWAKVRDHALRNFVLCSDGRLYHTFLAPLAVAAWDSKVKQSTKGAAGAKARWEKHTPKPRPSKQIAQAVDNHGTSTTNGVPAPSNPGGTGIDSDSTGSACAMKSDAEFKSPSSNTVLDLNNIARAHEGQPPEGNSKSKQEATVSPAYEATPQHLRKFLPDHLKPPQGSSES
jgi:hypothetical protein